jgi:hypothetical protein
MAVMATSEPIEPNKRKNTLWSEVWRDGTNLFELVEKRAGIPLPRGTELTTKLTDKSR